MIVKCWPQMSHNFGSLQLKFGGLKLLVVKDNLSCPELAPFGVPRNYFARSKVIGGNSGQSLTPDTMCLIAYDFC